jgi:hypothetical protein
MVLEQVSSTAAVSPDCSKIFRTMATVRSPESHARNSPLAYPSIVPGNSVLFWNHEKPESLRLVLTARKDEK